MFLELPGALHLDDVDRVRDLLADVDFGDARATAAGVAATRKRASHAFGDDGPAAVAADLVAAALQRSAVFRAAVLPRSTTLPRFVRYGVGDGYGTHVDAPVMGQPPLRSDVAVTVFLNDPRRYDGGELVITTDAGRRVVKLAAGAAVVYPASTLHRVEPVARGERVVAILWVQSLVRDPARRQILFDLAASLEQLDETSAPELADRLRRCEVNLTRMWAET